MPKEVSGEHHTLLLSITYGLPIGLLRTDSPFKVALICLVAFATTAFAGAHSAFWICQVTSLSMITVILTMCDKWLGYRPDRTAFVALFIGLWSVSASILRRFRQHLEGFSASRVLPVVSVLGAILVSRISWEPIAGFRTIVQFGEDNGAWLNNIALSLESSGSWSPAVGTSGGALLASIITAMTSLVNSSTLFSSNFGPAAVVLWRLYVWALLMLVVFGILIYFRLSRNTRNSVRFPIVALLILSSIVLGLNEIKGGYLTALLAALWISAAFWLAVVLDESKAERRVALFVLVGIVVVVVGELWFPLLAWIVMSVALSLVIAIEQLVSRFKIVTRKWLSSTNSGNLVKIAMTLVAVFTTSIFFSDLALKSPLADLSRATKLLHTGGGGGYWWFGLLILLAAVLLCVDPVVSSRVTLTTLVASTTLTIIVVFVLAKVIPPNEIGYGPSKMLGVLALSLLPFAILAVERVLLVLQNNGRPIIDFLKVSVLLVLALPLGLPLQDLQLTWKEPVEPYWFGAVVEARSRFPDRVPLCLDTIKGKGRSEGKYVCSRLASALVGGERSSISSQIHTFQWGNICTIDADRAHLIWNDDFFKNIVIIVSDRTRLSSEAECQSLELTLTDISPFGKFDGYDVWPVGWLSSVKWNLTEVIDLQGRDVQPNFDYLVNDPLDSPNPEYADVLTNFQSGG